MGLRAFYRRSPIFRIFYAELCYCFCCVGLELRTAAVGSKRGRRMHARCALAHSSRRVVAAWVLWQSGWAFGAYWLPSRSCRGSGLLVLLGVGAVIGSCC